MEQPPRDGGENANPSGVRTMRCLCCGAPVPNDRVQVSEGNGRGKTWSVRLKEQRTCEFCLLGECRVNGGFMPGHRKHEVSYEQAMDDREARRKLFRAVLERAHADAQGRGIRQSRTSKERLEEVKSEASEFLCWVRAS